ncbi:hypothetical protein CpipJ_CPIJ018531, partial [Culex quinquefasciatus]
FIYFYTCNCNQPPFFRQGRPLHIISFLFFSCEDHTSSHRTEGQQNSTE